jgi:hypothetical protein
MTVFSTMKATSHTHTGMAEMMPCMAMAAAKYSNAGMRM